MIEIATKLTSGLKWRFCEVNQRQTYRATTALFQFSSIERRFQNDQYQKSLYQQSRDTDVENAVVKRLNESEVKVTLGKTSYMPHIPVLKHNKHGTLRRVRNAGSGYQEVCLNDKLIPGPDVLHRLTATIFKLCDGLIAQTADI